MLLQMKYNKQAGDKRKTPHSPILCYVFHLCIFLMKPSYVERKSSVFFKFLFVFFAYMNIMKKIKIMEIITLMSINCSHFYSKCMICMKALTKDARGKVNGL